MSPTASSSGLSCDAAGAPSREGSGADRTSASHARCSVSSLKSGSTSVGPHLGRKSRGQQHGTNDGSAYNSPGRADRSPVASHYQDSVLALPELPDRWSSDGGRKSRPKRGLSKSTSLPNPGGGAGSPKECGMVGQLKSLVSSLFSSKAGSGA